MQIEQAVLGNRGPDGYRILARSDGFLDGWLPEAQGLCDGFGERVENISCTGCVFAQPFVDKLVAVVQAADQGTSLAFRLMILPRRFYENLGGDPFWLSEKYPPTWGARDLPTIHWDNGEIPPRTVEEVREVLKRDDSPTLLGSVQSLVDGGRVVLERAAPDTEFMSCLWKLLPTSTRCELWPASFAFGNALQFDALTVPKVNGPEYKGYLPEDQAGDYPEGRYELHLQIAAEAGDQGTISALFSRRSRAQVWRLALGVLAMMIFVPLILNLLWPTPKAEPRVPKLELPAAEEYPALTPDQRKQLTAALEKLAKDIDIPPMESSTAESLLEAIDRKAESKHDFGDIKRLGPPRRQLQALLWKHGDPGYNDDNLRTLELVDKLRKRLIP